MSHILESALELIGNTPLLKISRYAAKAGAADAVILAKLEYLNPAGSVKDRVALAMIEDAEQRGILKAGATIIEPTSGNTGIGLAMAAAAKGYRAVLTLPDTMSVERRNLLAAYGAKLVLTEGAKGMKGAIEKAQTRRRTGHLPDRKSGSRRTAAWIFSWPVSARAARSPAWAVI